MEGTRILRDCVQLSSQGAETPAIDAVAVSRRIHVRSCLVNSRMDSIGGRVQ
jgi:hypothetical protein